MTIAEAIMQSLFGFAFFGSLDAIIIPVLAISLSLFIPIVAIVVDYFQKKNKTRIIEKALEKGVPIENLALDEPRGNRMPYRSGMVSVAVGLGLIIFGLAIGIAMKQSGETEHFIPYAVFGGGGALVLLIGIALLVNDKMNYKRFFNGNGKESGRKDY